jgi:hypothetical protein
MDLKVGTFEAAAQGILSKGFVEGDRFPKAAKQRSISFNTTGVGGKEIQRLLKTTVHDAMAQQSDIAFDREAVMAKLDNDYVKLKLGGARIECYNPVSDSYDHVTLDKFLEFNSGGKIKIRRIVWFSRGYNAKPNTYPAGVSSELSSLRYEPWDEMDIVGQTSEEPDDEQDDTPRRTKSMMRT